MIQGAMIKVLDFDTNGAHVEVLFIQCAPVVAPSYTQKDEP